MAREQTSRGGNINSCGRSSVSRNPLLVGFGIATPADAASAAREADGVIIGSALIRKVRSGASPEALRAWVAGIKDALQAGT